MKKQSYAHPLNGADTASLVGGYPDMFVEPIINPPHSLLPFVTGWMEENHFAKAPLALYGVVLLMAAVAYGILQRTINYRRARRRFDSCAGDRNRLEVKNAYSKSPQWTFI